MDWNSKTQQVLTFLPVWITFLVGSIWWMQQLSSARKKRKAGYAIAWLSAALLIAYLYFLGVEPAAFLLFCPAILFITWVNIKTLRFCEKCSAFNAKQPLIKIDECRKCGEPLEKTPL